MNPFWSEPEKEIAVDICSSRKDKTATRQNRQAGNQKTGQKQRSGSLSEVGVRLKLA